MLRRRARHLLLICRANKIGQTPRGKPSHHSNHYSDHGPPMTSTDALSHRPRTIKKSELPGRVVLVMQGGGAPGSYQAGAYQALHEAGIEPDWVIGTSIGAINGAIIAGNEVVDRVKRLREFWRQLDSRVPVNWRRFSSECPASTK